MEHIIISDGEDRRIALGLRRGKRYAEEVREGLDPWWDFHVTVKKPGIDLAFVSESMNERELRELLSLIGQSRNFSRDREERISFMEPDYDFSLARHYGIFRIHLGYADSLCIWLERAQLDAIGRYITNVLSEDEE